VIIELASALVFLPCSRPANRSVLVSEDTVLVSPGKMGEPLFAFSVCIRDVGSSIGHYSGVVMR
jgi:hypothetical protein